MKKYGISRFVLLVLLFGLGGVAHAESRNEEQGVFTLGEVVVRGKQEGVETIGTVLETTALEIEEKNAETLEKALELLPGLDVRSGAQGIPRINLRGFRSRHVVLLLNGIPFNSSYDGQFDPSIISTENIAKIKVTYGTHSVLYGQGGLGGVINIITKKGTQGLNGSLTGEVAGRGGMLGRFNLSGGGEAFNFFLSGSVDDSDGFRLSEDFEPTSEESGGLRENSDKERENLFANVDFKPGDDWQIGLTLEHSGGEFGSPPSVINDRNDSFAKRPKYTRVEDYSGFSTQLAALYDPDSPFGLRAWVFYNELEQDEAQYDDSNYDTITARNSFREENKARSQGGTLQARYDLGDKSRLTAAFSVQTDEYAVDGETGRGNPIHLNEDLDIYNLALEYDVSPFPNLEFVAGYSHHWLGKGDGEDDHRGSFLLGSSYVISERTQVRGSLARKIRFPSIQQLYDTDAGNSNLDTEKSINYELGMTHQLPWNLTADLVGFSLDVEEYIEKDDDTDRYENHDEYRFRGIELTLEKPFLETGSLLLGYTYLDSKDKSPGTQKDELEYRPKHKVTLQGRYVWRFGLSAYASFSHIAGQYHYFSDDPVLKRELNDYILVDLKLEETLMQGRLSAYMGADNLFDKNYEESYGFPQAGRMIYGGLKVMF